MIEELSRTESASSNNPIFFSEQAAVKVKHLIDEEKGDLQKKAPNGAVTPSNLMLRIFISGGGCSGFQYGFTFDSVIQEDDTVVEKAGVKLLIDSISIAYLFGAEIDYKDGIEGSQFVIKNPNAKTTCGCGNSFTTE